MKELLIRLVVGLAVIVVVVLALTWVAGDDLTKPTNRDITIGRPPLDLEASNITFASGSGSLIHGWLSAGKPGQGAVILLHGLRGDRRDMVSRAEFLRARTLCRIFSDSPQCAHDLPREIHLCALRNHRERHAIRARMGRLRDLGDQQHHATTRENLR